MGDLCWLESYIKPPHRHLAFFISHQSRVAFFFFGFGTKSVNFSLSSMVTIAPDTAALDRRNHLWQPYVEGMQEYKNSLGKETYSICWKSQFQSQFRYFSSYETGKVTISLSFIFHHYKVNLIKCIFSISQGVLKTKWRKSACLL